MRFLCPALGVILFAPALASALTLVQAVGMFHIAVGLLVTLTFGIFVTGLVMYFSRFNTWPSYRDSAIKVLMWAVAMLFTLILLIAIVQFIQRHSAIALTILGVVLILGVALIAARIVGRKGGESGEGEK